MQWLNKVVDEIETRHPDGEILIESGGSPTGTHHVGHIRELVTSDAIMTELRRRGRAARHIYFADDLDAFRKVPVNVPAEYDKYLGMPLCEIPSPSGEGSYADYFLDGLIKSCQNLGLEVEFVRSHEKYRAGFFVPAIEKALENIDKVRNVLENISGHKLGEEWSPVQINEDGYLKKRKFISIDKDNKKITYADKDGHEQEVGYQNGEVKLDWRIDWPARWWLLNVNAEPAGRDHSSAGGSFDTGLALVKDVFGAEGPIPVPYDFINLVGDTKKMSASKGTGIAAEEASQIMPGEVWRYFILRSAPSKLIYFDPVNGVVKLMDEFAELLAKEDKSDSEKQLIEIATKGVQPTTSNVPFSHLVASYQSALRDKAKTLDILKRTEYAEIVSSQKDVIIQELDFIDKWLHEWAPEDVKFELRQEIDPSEFSDTEKEFLSSLADKIENAPENADGEWFHKAIYEFKESHGAEPKQLFATLYKALIGKSSGPRAGWFLSILPRDWLCKRLRLEA
jgi:lysyl-tRNA synthetase class 1